MRVRSLSLILGAAAIVGAGIYLVIQVGTEPELPRPEAAPPSSRPVTEPASEPAATEVPLSPSGRPERPIARRIRSGPNARAEVEATMPDYLLEGIRNPPKPFQARSEPAKAKELYVGVHTEELAERVNHAHIHYRKRRYQEAIDEILPLIDEIPENKQLVRVLIRSACNAHQPDLALEHLSKLSSSDQEYMIRHCRTYGSPIDGSSIGSSID